MRFRVPVQPSYSVRTRKLGLYESAGSPQKEKNIRGCRGHPWSARTIYRTPSTGVGDSQATTIDEADKQDGLKASMCPASNHVT